MITETNSKEKYVLLVSPSEEITSNKVIDWILYYGFNPLKVNVKSKFEVEYVDIQNPRNTIIKINGKAIKLSQIKAYWYKGGDFSLTHKGIITDENIISHLNMEWEVLKDYLHFVLKDINGLGNKEMSHPNKLIQLHIAQQVGLKIPQTEIVTLASQLRGDDIVVKAIQEGYHCVKDDINIASYTEKLNFKTVQANSSFFPTLTQECVNYKFEIRSVFVKDKFFSAAIIQNRNNSIDYRKNDKRNLKIMPYELPKDLELKLIAFAQKLNLDCGAFDLLCTSAENYFFLEINPVGKFEFISRACNYQIEEYIAKILVN